MSEETRHRIVRRIHRGEPRLVQLTAIAERPLRGPRALRELFESLAAALREQDASPLHEKVYGEAAAAREIRRARDTAWAHAGLPAETPMVVVGNTPCVGGEVAGVQLLAVSSRTDGTLRTLWDHGAPVGRELQLDGERLVLLTDLTGGNPDGGPEEQFGGMFALAAERLRALDLTFHDVARTWIHVDCLLPWYDALNRVRTAFFEQVGLVEPGKAQLPASTGIQGTHPDGHGGLLELLAVTRDDGAAFEPMRTSRQCGAFEYGSAFSRGMVVPLGDARLLLASGTASIDGEGNTVHVGDPAAQVRETYAAVEALWDAQDADWSSVVTGVLFFKDPETWAAAQQLQADGELPDIPGIPVFGDVCRDDLLFELEATAID